MNIWRYFSMQSWCKLYCYSVASSNPPVTNITDSHVGNYRNINDTYRRIFPSIVTDHLSTAWMSLCEVCNVVSFSIDQQPFIVSLVVLVHFVDCHCSAATFAGPAPLTHFYHTDKSQMVMKLTRQNHDLPGTVIKLTTVSCSDKFKVKVAHYTKVTVFGLYFCRNENANKYIANAFSIIQFDTNYSS